ncbi:hypothetical protein NQZ68_013330 [Dissostichus eleginoides]|nr:hypothetical protein NQZ68_013330 [Dissostichus eleginoides]
MGYGCPPPLAGGGGVAPSKADTRVITALLTTATEGGSSQIELRPGCHLKKRRKVGVGLGTGGAGGGHGGSPSVGVTPVHRCSPLHHYSCSAYFASIFSLPSISMDFPPPPLQAAWRRSSSQQAGEHRIGRMKPLSAATDEGLARGTGLGQ